MKNKSLDAGDGQYGNDPGQEIPDSKAGGENAGQTAQGLHGAGLRRPAV